jgi:hypothetical protein
MTTIQSKFGAEWEVTQRDDDWFLFDPKNFPQACAFLPRAEVLDSLGAVDKAELAESREEQLADWERDLLGPQNADGRYWHRRSMDNLKKAEIATSRAEAAEAKLEELDLNPWKARAQNFEVKLAEAERSATELAPERDERVIAWESIVKHEAFRVCFKEDRPLLHAMLDRLSSLAEAEATIERVKVWAVDYFGALDISEGLDAALTPPKPFELPTEAGVRFYATKNGEEELFTTYTDGDVCAYRGAAGFETAVSIMANGWTDHRLLESPDA